VGLPFIVLGDRTSHGGTVIGADFTCDINGKYIARVGDLVVCPTCRGAFPISVGAPDMISMGQAPARHGDKTACGATLLSGQVTTTWSDQSSAETQRQTRKRTHLPKRRGSLPPASQAFAWTAC
jgi:uncharacterized Zn-binding protein involved in type VI secretion